MATTLILNDDGTIYASGEGDITTGRLRGIVRAWLQPARHGADYYGRRATLIELHYDAPAHVTIVDVEPFIDDALLEGDVLDAHYCDALDSLTRHVTAAIARADAEDAHADALAEVFAALDRARRDVRAVECQWGLSSAAEVPNID